MKIMKSYRLEIQKIDFSENLMEFSKPSDGIFEKRSFFKM